MSRIRISYLIKLEIRLVMNYWYINIGNIIIIVIIIIVVRPINMIQAIL